MKKRIKKLESVNTLCYNRNYKVNKRGKYYYGRARRFF